MRHLQDPRGTPLTRRHVRLLATVALGVLLADIATKIWAVERLTGRSIRLIGGWVVLHATRNPGAAFSLAGGATLLFSLVAIAVIVAILRTARRLRSTPWAITLALLLGGALGNLADRVFRSPGPLRGHVVDFIDLQKDGRSLWPVFNVADMAIVTGGVLAVLLAWRRIELDGTRPRRGDTEHSE